MSDTDQLLSPGGRDVQAGRPATEVSLTRVGVRGVEKIIHVAGAPRHDEETPVESRGSLFFAELECTVDLKSQQAGVHMSRFEEIVNEAIDGAVLSNTLRTEELAGLIAEQVRERQHGKRAEVRIAARYPRNVPAPVSGIPTQEIYTLHGIAVASERGTRTLTGVEAHGMTACPCAQEMLTDRARERLEADGFTSDEIERVFTAVPVATHNQRGIGTLQLGSPEGSKIEIDARDLLEIVEQSMSSEIYELMKRGDEAHVVEKAHRNPRFVEDVVREMVRRVSVEYPELTDGGFLVARQENLETIHRHTVIAERTGLVAEILAELAGEGAVPQSGEDTRRHMTEREWLEAPSA